jgi:hypothetical protein
MWVTLGRCRSVALVAAAVLSVAVGCSGSPSRDAGATPTPTPTRPPPVSATTLLPARPPAGFSLSRVDLAALHPTANNDWNGRNVTLYGDPDLDDSARGPLLFAYRAWGEDYVYTDAVLKPLSGCGAAELRATGVGSKHGQVESCAGTYVVAWDTNPEDFSDESVGLVGRDVTPEQVARAADAMSVPKGGVGVPHRPLTIPAGALPDGLTRLASGPMPAGGNGDTFVWEKNGASSGSPGSASLRLSTVDAYDGALLLARAFVGGEARQIRGSLGAFGPLSDGRREMTWQEDGLLVSVTTNAVDKATTEEFVRSLTTVPIGKALELQKSFMTRPPETFLDTGEKLALSGRTNGRRWVLAVSADGKRRRGFLIEETGEHPSFGGRTGKPRREQFIAANIGYTGGDQVVVVQVHADVAKVVLTARPDGRQIELTPGPSVLPDGSRYFGTWLDQENSMRRITSYDADGNQISYQTSLAPYATPRVR